MKSVDLINSLIKERDELKNICKEHANSILLLKREMVKLKNTISKKDKIIQKLESESINIKMKNELDKVKNELKKIKTEYKELQSNYKTVVIENIELKGVIDDAESTCDSD